MQIFSKFNPFFLVQRYISGKIFIKIRCSFYGKLLTDRQKDGQTDRQATGKNTTSLAR